MSAYLSQVQAEAHAAELAEDARRARRAHPVATSDVRPRRLRSSAARMLLGLAVRLDHGLRSTTVRPS
jgi:hypothetical protein